MLESTSRAVAALNAGAWALRRSVSGEARSAVCGMGSCMECRDRQGLRTCLPLQAGAGAEHRRCSTDVLVVGAGPAGLQAASIAQAQGQRVLLVDENSSVGGQIWRASARRAPAGVEFVAGASAIQALDARTLRVAHPAGTLDVQWSRLVLATGARERYLPFPGWTLPGVYGAGGLQALVKAGLDVRRQRIVLAGSGPLLLAVASLLLERGARVLCVLEQASAAAERALGRELLTRPAKLAQAVGFLWRLRTIPRHFQAWPIAAEGRERLQALQVRTTRGVQRIECDAAGIGFGLVPNTQLGQALGLELNGAALRVDGQQASSVDGIFAAGECTGIGGVDKARLEGELAGWQASGARAPAGLLARVERERRFAGVLEARYALRPELRELVQPDTIVCRCEDVRWQELQAHSTWREARLQSRCGMGACQGRVCGPALEFLSKLSPRDPRPPYSPVPMGQLAREP